MNLKKIFIGQTTDIDELKCQGTNTTDPSIIDDVDSTSIVLKPRPSSPDSVSDLTAIELKTDFFKQDDCYNQPFQSSLCSRYVDRNVCTYGLKQEIFRAGLTRQSLECEKDRLLKQLDIKDQLLSDLKKDLNIKERLLHQQKRQLEEALRRLSVVNNAKASLASRLLENNKRLCFMEQSRNSKLQNREELLVVHDALNSLRNCFSVHDPNHHTIDTLEQSVASLMERLNLLQVNFMEQKAKKILESKYDTKRIHISPVIGVSMEKLEYLNGHHEFKKQPKKLTSTEQSDNTKVVYFTERTVTPFLTFIPKRLGEITLKDFKSLFDRPGVYRYHFKAEDSEYGMVKEEVVNDAEILPGWRGKIIAWIEEDHAM